MGIETVRGWGGGSNSVKIVLFPLLKRGLPGSLKRKNLLQIGTNCSLFRINPFFFQKELCMQECKQDVRKSQKLPPLAEKLPGPSCSIVVSLTSSLRVISLTVLADSIYSILIFFAEKM